MFHVLLFLAIKSHFLFLVCRAVPRYQHKRDVDERPIERGAREVVGVLRMKVAAGAYLVWALKERGKND